MRLLAVTPFYKPAYSYGGPTRSIPALCEGLARLGLDVTVFTTNANGRSSLDLAANVPLSVDGVSVSYFERDVQNNYFYSRQLANACHQSIGHFDCVYVNSNWGYPLIPACRASLKHRVPYVITPRTSFMQKTWEGKHVKKWAYHQLIERSLINRATTLHYTTQLEADESQWLNLKPDYFLVPNPVDTSEFDQMPPRGSWRELLGIDPDVFVILYLGRIESRKGLDVTVRSFARLRQSRQDTVLVLAGPDEDNYTAMLQSLAAELGVAKHILFTGYINSKTRLQALADADIFILTSYSENFGMAVVEAMLAGLSVVVSNQVGIAPDILTANAGLVTTLDPYSIAETLEQLLSSNEARRTLGKRASKFAFERYTTDRVAHSMLSELEKLVR